MAANVSNNVFAFGIESVYVGSLTLDATSTVYIPTVFNQIQGVQSAVYKGTQAQVEFTGDDRVLSYAYHSPKGTLTVKGEMIMMAALTAVTGNANTTNGSTLYSMSFGTDNDTAQRVVQVKAVTKARDRSGNPHHINMYFYRCFVTTAWDTFPSGNYNKAAELTIMFNCLQGQLDETGRYQDNLVSGPYNWFSTSNAWAIGRFEIQSTAT